MLVEVTTCLPVSVSVSAPEEVEEEAPHVSRHCGFVACFCFHSSVAVNGLNIRARRR